jgi:hypothetical protein
VSQRSAETAGCNSFMRVDTANQITVAVWCNQPVTTNLLPTATG